MNNNEWENVDSEMAKLRNEIKILKEENQQLKYKITKMKSQPKNYTCEECGCEVEIRKCNGNKIIFVKKC